MPYREYSYMLELKQVVESRRMLADMKVSAYPHSKPDHAKNFHRKLSQVAYPTETREAVSNEQAFQTFQRITKNGR